MKKYQKNIGSIVNNGNNSIMSNNIINNSKKIRKEDEFIEILKNIIKDDKDSDKMLKTFAIDKLNNIKKTNDEKKRQKKWKEFRSMTADWTTITTALSTFFN